MIIYAEQIWKPYQEKIIPCNWNAPLLRVPLYLFDIIFSISAENYDF